MKIQLDTTTKTISIEDGDYEFSEIIKKLSKLLPNNEWKKWKLKTGTAFTYWVTNPIPINYWIIDPYVWPYTPNYIPYVQGYPNTTTINTTAPNGTITYQNNTVPYTDNFKTYAQATSSSWNMNADGGFTYRENDTVEVNIALDNFGKLPSTDGIYCVEC